MQARKDAEAFRALDDVLTNELDAGAIVLQAMKRTDTLMRAPQQPRGPGAGLRADLAAHAGAQSIRLRLLDAVLCSGKAYLDLLTSLGNQPAAQRCAIGSWRSSRMGRSCGSDPRPRARV